MDQSLPPYSTAQIALKWDDQFSEIFPQQQQNIFQSQKILNPVQSNVSVLVGSIPKHS